MEDLYPISSTAKVKEADNDFSLPSDLPILLFPIRLETRFMEDELWVRIFPDELILENHDPRITPTEKEVLEAFLAISQEDLKQNFWRYMVQRFGARRASWLINKGKEAISKGYFDFEDDSLNYCRILPDKFVAYLYTPDQIMDPETGEYPEPLDNYKQEGNPILFDDIIIKNEDPNISLLKGLNLFPEVSDEENWLYSFEKAVEVGMGIKIPLNGKREFSRLLVFGVRQPKEAYEAGEFSPEETIQQLFEGHTFSDGLSFLEHGTPTNNTSRKKSGHSESENQEKENTYIFAKQRLPTKEPEIPYRGKVYGQQLSHLLGIPQATFDCTPGAAKAESEIYSGFQHISWLIMGNYSLDIILNHNYTPRLKWEIWNHFSKYVMARGPIPSLKIGDQPYGALPVIRKKFDLGSSFPIGDLIVIRKISTFLFELYKIWDKICANPDCVPKLESDGKAMEKQISQVLSMASGSQKVDLVPANDGGFDSLISSAVLGSIDEIKGEEGNSPTEKYKQFVEEKGKQVQTTFDRIGDVLYGIKEILGVPEEEKSALFDQYIDLFSPESQFLELFPFGKAIPFEKEQSKNINEEDLELFLQLKEIIDNIWEISNSPLVPVPRDPNKKLPDFYKQPTFKKLWSHTNEGSTDGNTPQQNLALEVLLRCLKYFGRYYETNRLEIPSRFPQASYSASPSSINVQYYLEEILVKKGQFVAKDEPILRFHVFIGNQNIKESNQNLIQSIFSGNVNNYLAWKQQIIAEREKTPTTEPLPPEFPNLPSYLQYRFFPKVTTPNTKTFFEFTYYASRDSIIDDIPKKPLQALNSGDLLVTSRVGYSPLSRSAPPPFQTPETPLKTLRENFHNVIKPLTSSEDPDFNTWKAEAEAAILDTIDLSTSRLDAWLTSLATYKLLEIRKTKPQGLYIGCFGYLENLKVGKNTPNNSNGDATDGEYIHAPSVEQAQVLAVTKHAFRNHIIPDESNPGPSKGNPAAMDLTSERVQIAEYLNQGMRNGVSFSELIGGKFKDEMYRAGMRDRYEDYAIRYPLLPNQAIVENPQQSGQNNIDEGTEFKELEQSQQKVDGMSLLKDFPNIKSREAAQTNGKVVIDIVNNLLNASDAQKDVNLYSALYNELIFDNPERTAAFLAASKGKGKPPQLHSLSTPVKGIEHSYSFISLVKESLSSFSAQNPKGFIEPSLEGWLSEYIGPLNNIFFTVSIQQKIGEEELIDVSLPNVSEEGEKVSLENLKLGYLDLYDICEQDVTQDQSIIRILSGYYLYRKIDLKNQIPEDYAEWQEPFYYSINPGPSLKEEEITLEETLSKLRIIKAFLSKCTPLTPDKLVHPGRIDEPTTEYKNEDLIDFYKRVNELASEFENILQELNSSGTPLAILEKAILYKLPEALSLYSPYWQYLRERKKGEADQRYEEAVKRVQGAIEARFTAYEKKRKELTDRFPFLTNPSNPSQTLDAVAFNKGFQLLSQAIACLFSPSAESKDPKAPFPISYIFTTPGDFKELATRNPISKVLPEQAELRIEQWIYQKAEVSSSCAAFELFYNWEKESSLSVLQHIPILSPPDINNQQTYELKDFPWMDLSDQEIKNLLTPSFQNEINQWLGPQDNLHPGARVPRPKSSYSNILHFGTGINLENSVPTKLSGWIIEDHSDTIPYPEIDSGISFYQNSPNSEAPQSMLVAVPYQGQDTWNNKELSQLLLETVDMAKIRLVDREALQTYGMYFPSALFPIDADYDQKEPGRSILAPKSPINSSLNIALTRSNSLVNLTGGSEKLAINSSNLVELIVAEMQRFPILSSQSFDELERKFNSLSNLLKKFIREIIIFFLNKEGIRIEGKRFTENPSNGNSLPVPIPERYKDVPIPPLLPRRDKNIDIRIGKAPSQNNFGLYIKEGGITITPKSEKNDGTESRRINYKPNEDIFRFKLATQKKPFFVQGFNSLGDSVYDEVINTEEETYSIIIQRPDLKYLQIFAEENSGSEAYISFESLF